MTETDLTARLAALSPERRRLLELAIGGNTAKRPITGPIDAWADTQPNALALRVADATMTYAELRKKSEDLMRSLAGQGIRQGTIVGLTEAQPIDAAICLMALLKLGAHALLLPVDDPADAMRGALREARTNSLLAAPGTQVPEGIALLNRDGPEMDVPQADDGTILVPGVGTIDPSMLSAWVDWREQRVALSPGDCVLRLSGTPWAGTPSELLWPLIRGATMFSAGSEPGPAATGLLDASARYAVRVACLTPPALGAMLAGYPDMPLPASLEIILCAGGPLPAGIGGDYHARGSARLVHFFAPFAGPPIAWGAVETGAIASTDAGFDNLIAPADWRVLSANDRPVPAGLVGQVEFAGQRLMEAGRLHRTGTLSLVGSVQGALRLRGHVVFPAMIERSLRALPAVADCRVIHRHGTLVAYVVPATRAGATEITAQLAHRVPQALRPDTIATVTALPLTLAGEIDETQLAALPVPDDVARATWQHAIGGLPGVTAVTVESVAAEIKAGAPTPGRSGQAVAAEPITSLGAAFDEPLPPGLPALLQRAAERDGHGIRFLNGAGERFLSYRDLLDMASRLLGRLLETGCTPGDPVLLQLAHQNEYLIGLWACLLGGFLPVPVSQPAGWDEPSAPTRTLANVWKMLDRPRILAGLQEAAGLRALEGQLNLDRPLDILCLPELLDGPISLDWHMAALDDPCLLLLTSGSTGTPKAVIHTARTLLSRCVATAQHRGYTAGEVTLNWLPLDHVGAVVMFHLRDVFLGCQQIHAPTALVLEDPLRWLDWIAQYRVTVTWSPNFAFALVNARAEAIATRDWDLSTLKVVINAGEAIVPRTARRFLSLLAPHGLRETAMAPEWGMSETASAVTGAVMMLADSDDRDKYVDLGGPLPGTQLRIVDGVAAGADEPAIGRLQLRGATVTPGYFRNDEANREAFTADGWLETGDLGFLRAGRLSITGRAKDSVIVNGVNHLSQDIEAIVEEVPGVAVSFTAACAYRPANAETDELILFFVPEDASRPPVTAIRTHLALQMGVSASQVVPLDAAEVPKTAIGKIQRAQLRARFEQGEFAGRVDAHIRKNNAGDAPLAATIQWRRAQSPRPCDITQLGTCAIIQRTGPLAGALGDHLATYSAMHVTEPADTVFYLACDESGDGPQTLGALIALLRGLDTARRPGGTVRLIVVTRRSIAAGGPVGGIAHSVVNGWLQSATAEVPWLVGRQIDLDEMPVAEAVKPILDSAAGDEPLVAYRDGRRLVPRVSPAATVPTGVQQLRRNGFYVLAGGLGGIGTLVARHLTYRFNAKLLLLGRRTEAEAAPDLTTLGGDVIYRACDIANAQALNAAVAETIARFDQKPDGVFNLAADGRLSEHWAALEARGALDQSPEAVSLALAAKVAGSINLMALIADIPDALFVGFSSVAGSFGAGSLALYAAANSFLDALCLDRHAKGGAALTLGWSMWDNTGMAAGVPEGVRERALSLGYRALVPSDGIACLERALTLGLPQLVIGLDDRHPAWRRSGARPLAGLETLRAAVAADGPALKEARRLRVRDRFGRWVPCEVAQPIHATETGNIATSATATPLEAAVQAIWYGLLEANEIGLHDNFFEIGGHSLLLARLRAQLVALAGHEVTVAELFRAPSIHDQALLIEDKAARKMSA